VSRWHPGLGMAHIRADDKPDHKPKVSARTPPSVTTAASRLSGNITVGQAHWAYPRDLEFNHQTGQKPQIFD